MNDQRQERHAQCEISRAEFERAIDHTFKHVEQLNVKLDGFMQMVQSMLSEQGKATERLNVNTETMIEISYRLQKSQENHAKRLVLLEEKIKTVDNIQTDISTIKDKISQIERYEDMEKGKSQGEKSFKELLKDNISTIFQWVVSLIAIIQFIFIYFREFRS